MIIEFTAAQGSGKTYLSNALSSYLKSVFDSNYVILTTRDIEVIKSKKYKYNIFRKLYTIISFISIVDINIMKLLVLYINKKERLLIKIRHLFYIISVISNYKFINDIKKNKSEKYLFILEEGVVHLANIFFEDNKKYNSVIKYFDLVFNSKLDNARNNIYIFVDSSLEENIKRINLRQQGWPRAWKKLSYSEREKSLKNFFDSYNVVKKYIYRKKSNCFTINNTIFNKNYEKEFNTIIKMLDSQKL